MACVDLIDASVASASARSTSSRPSRSRSRRDEPLQRRTSCVQGREAALRQTAMQRHLAAFETDFVEAAGTGLLTFVAAACSLAPTAADTATDAVMKRCFEPAQPAGWYSSVIVGNP